MNKGPDFQPRADDDDARDPLLGALRQRLGEHFGQEPPPALWASIRQQLPAAAPRPWWRSRGLLALVALVGAVLLSGVAVWLTHTQPAARRLAHAPAAQPVATPREQGASSAATTAARPLAASSPAPTPKAATGNPRGLAATQAPGATARLQALSTPGRATSTSAPGNSEKPFSDAIAARPAKPKMRGAALAAQRQPRHRHQQSRRLAGELAAATPAGRPAIAAPAAGPELAQPNGSPPTAAGAAASTAAGQVAPGAATPLAPTGLVAAHSARRTSERSAKTLGRRLARAATAETAAATPATTSRHRRAAGKLADPRGSSELEASWLASGRPATVAAPALPDALDSLAARRAGWPLVALALPAPLVSRPDSAGPWLVPARRWSVLALAGPTISYRTMGQPFTNIPAYTPSPTNTTSFSGGGNSSTSLVGLERPAAGLGAQVQVRRVLTGRWALALGAGYQEYATRLALQVTSRQATSPLNSSFRDSTFAVHQRDTYRFLTLPVQLSYALGPPRGRLSLGLLAGLEPSLYVGGRTTEGSSCSCQQQVFTSASGSPYSALSLGLSLGLEARYRLGGPAARWQWVLQPTGRYVATRLVRAASLGYVQRQPYSFGLLTGLAWEF